MRILFLGMLDDVHCLKWADWFADKHRVILRHADPFSLKTIPKNLSIVRLIRAEKDSFDILHAHYAGTWGLMGALSGFHPFVVSIHGSEVLLTKRLKNRLVRWALNRADLITTDDKGGRIRLLLDRWGIKTPLKMIRFGIDIKRFKRDGDKAEVPTVCYRVGEGPVYDVQTIMQAQDILNRANSSDRQMSVRFLPLKGIPQDDLPAHLNFAWIYVSAALSDPGLAVTTGEAMACELPVVISDVAENDIWVDNRQLFEARNPMDLANKIQWFLDEGEPTRDLFGSTNRMKIVHQNNYHYWMGEMNKLYEEVIQNDGRHKI